MRGQLFLAAQSNLQILTFGDSLITTLKQQAKDLFEELHDRVDWPTKEKVLNSTWTVVFISVFVGLFLWGADWFITWGMKYLLPHH